MNLKKSGARAVVCVSTPAPMSVSRSARGGAAARLGRLVLALGLGAGALGSLSACAPLLLGGAFVGGGLMAVDRRTTGTQIEDQGLEIKAAGKAVELLGKSAHVNVTAYNRIVLLTGEVPSEAGRQQLEQAVQRLENARSVVNELAVAGVSSLGSRSNDTVLSTKVKSSLLDAKDLPGSAVKVVTERAIVYLMGRVTEREARRATDIARGVSGVQKVVRVFEVVSEEELAETTPKAAPAVSR